MKLNKLLKERFLSARNSVSYVVSLLLLAVLSTPTHAGKFGRTLDIGNAAPVWKNLPGTDGKQHSLADLKDKSVVVVVFTCNSCPYATDYEDRIISFVNKYCGGTSKKVSAGNPDRSSSAKSKVALVAINVNKVPDDLMPAMKKRSAEKKFSFPYLLPSLLSISNFASACFSSG